MNFGQSCVLKMRKFAQGEEKNLLFNSSAVSGYSWVIWYHLPPCLTSKLIIFYTSGRGIKRATGGRSCLFMPVEFVKGFCMLHDLVLATRYAALANAGITHLSLDRSVAVVSGSSSSHNLLLIAGVIGLLVILGAAVAVLFVRHKQAKTWDESGYQSGSVVFNNRPGSAGYGQNYSRGMIAAEQEPWPWVRKPSPPTGYNPVTPVPEMLRKSPDPMTPVPEVPAVSAFPMRYPVQSPPAQPLPVQPSVPPPAQPLPVQSPSVQASIMVPDPALEAIMRQVQVGLFALPVQNKGQKDRAAAL